ncbi:MAG: hypothetical protein WBE42_16085, partial [Pseudolabrys sp.]
HKPKGMAPTMVDVVKQQARLRYRAKRLGYCLMQTRGIENQRREASGVGTFVLFGPDGVALSAATLSDIAEFLEAHDRTQRRQLH